MAFSNIARIIPHPVINTEGKKVVYSNGRCRHGFGAETKSYAQLVKIKLHQFCTQYAQHYSVPDC